MLFLKRTLVFYFLFHFILKCSLGSLALCQFFCVESLNMVFGWLFCIHKLFISHPPVCPLGLSCFMGTRIEDGSVFRKHFSSPSNGNNWKTHLLPSAHALLGDLVSHMLFAAFKKWPQLFLLFQPNFLWVFCLSVEWTKDTCRRQSGCTVSSLRPCVNQITLPWKPF